MPTPTKTRRRTPPTGGQPSRGFPRPRGTSQPPRRRPQFPRTSIKPAAKGAAGLIGRVRASLPGRKPTGKKNGVNSIVSSLGSVKNRAAARKPSKKGIAGIVVGGLGVATMARRRRGGEAHEGDDAARFAR